MSEAPMYPTPGSCATIRYSGKISSRNILVKLRESWRFQGIYGLVCINWEDGRGGIGAGFRAQGSGLKVED